MKITLLSLLVAAALTACGGGSSSPSAGLPGQTNVAAIDVATASQATATAASLVAVSGTASGEVAYDVAADIGDSWRIFINSGASTYRIQIISSQYGLQAQSGTFNTSTVGNKTTLTATTGASFVLTIDNRTKLVSGKVGFGGKNSSVSGTGYAVSDLSKLAGTYLYVGAVRDISGLNSEIIKGSFNINANGGVSVCANGVFNAGVCSSVSSTLTTSTDNVSFVKDATTGVIRVKNATNTDFGIVHVHAGDRGPVLILDRFGYNTGGTTLRVGTIAAVKQAKLTTELNGTYTCSQKGTAGGSYVVNGTTATVTNGSTGLSHTENVSLNKVSNGSALIDLDGVASFVVPGETPGSAATVMPLSSSFAVTLSQGQTIGLCKKED